MSISKKITEKKVIDKKDLEKDSTPEKKLSLKVLHSNKISQINCIVCMLITNVNINTIYRDYITYIQSNYEITIAPYYASTSITKLTILNITIKSITQLINYENSNTNPLLKKTFDMSDDNDIKLYLVISYSYLLVKAPPLSELYFTVLFISFTILNFAIASSEKSIENIKLQISYFKKIKYKINSDNVLEYNAYKLLNKFEVN